MADTLLSLREWLAGDNEEHVMTLVEDPSWIEYVRRLLAAYDAHTVALTSIWQLGSEERDRTTAESALNHGNALLRGEAE